MDKPDKSDKSARRRIGVENLNARGILKPEIARDIDTTVDNLRALLRPGRGKRSSAGTKLDRYLEIKHAFDRSLIARSANGIGRTGEEFGVYKPRREINLPSAAQMEELWLVARRSESRELEDEVKSMEADVLSVRERCNEIEARFLDLLSRAQAGAA